MAGPPPPEIPTPPYGPPAGYGSQPPAGYGPQPPAGYGSQPPAPIGYGGPYPYSAGPGYGYQPPPRKRRRISALGCIVIVLLLLVVAVIVVAAGLATGAIKTGSLLNLVGMGPSRVEVTNMRDTSISVVLQKTNPDGTTVTSDGQLNSFDVRNLTASEPGRFVLTITDDTGTQIASCSLNVTAGSKWQFVAMDQLVIVTRNDERPASPDDLFVSSSSLCR